MDDTGKRPTIERRDDTVRPNVVVFFTDQQRWDTCGCYGNPMGLTPVLDAMAARGTRLDRSFTVQPVCGPARACLQTGRYATETGCYRNGIPLPPEERTLAHHFRDAGYYTGYVGKWHLADDWRIDASGKLERLPPESPVPSGRRGGYEDYWMAADVLEFLSHPYDFRVYDRNCNLVSRPGYRVDVQTDLAIEFIDDEAARTGRPFFLFVSYLEPHHQNDWNRFVAPHGYADKIRGNMYIPPDLPPGKGDWEAQLADYYGMCRSLDENLGRILSALERNGVADNTVVLFCADHGCHFRTRNGEYKRSCHESSIRVPTVFSGPGFEGGTVIENMVDLLDWPVTLLDAAGIARPQAMRGRSIIPLVHGNDSGWRDEVFVQISENQVGRAIRTPKWKYAVVAHDRHGWNDSGADSYSETCLYDLESDPHERNNLVSAPESAIIREQLSQRLKDRMREAGENVPTIEPAREERS